MQKNTNKKFVPPIVFAVLALIAVVSFVAQTNRRQPAPGKLNFAAMNFADNFALNANRAVVVQTTNANLSANALSDSINGRNLDCKNNLIWAFGGKAQRGWYLYESLIVETIFDKNAKDNDFSRALARWQQTNGVEPNGVLDETALAAMIKSWQSNRLKNHDYAAPDNLLTAPAEDFWDAARAPDLRQVERETYAAYKKMIRAAAADKSLKLSVDSNGNLAANEKFLKIVSAFRSREHQARLRAASPNSGRAGLAVNSPHFTGHALDIYVGGEPVETKDQNRFVQINTPVYKWLIKNAGKFGFKPYFYEPWHWEYAPDENARATAN